MDQLKLIGRLCLRVLHRPITAFELWMKENVMVDTVSSSPSQGELSQVDCVELFSSLPTEERRVSWHTS